MILEYKALIMPHSNASPPSSLGLKYLDSFSSTTIFQINVSCEVDYLMGNDCTEYFVVDSVFILVYIGCESMRIVENDVEDTKNRQRQALTKDRAS